MRRSSLLIATLAAVVTASACVAPLYERAMVQALTQVRLDALTPVDSVLRVTALSTTPQADLGGVSTITVDLAEVASSVPAQVRRHLLRPVRGVAVLESSTVSGRSVQGVIRWRAGMCTHVRVVTGRCPSAAREVLVSTADARRFGWVADRRLRVLEQLAPGLSKLEPGLIGLTVVGTYRQVDRRWWDGIELTGKSGRPADPRSNSLLHDAVLTGRASMIGAERVQWADATYHLDYRLRRDGAGADQVLALGPAMRSFAADPRSSYVLTATSSLPGEADRVRVGRDQARTTVPLLVAQLGLVGFVVLWLVLAAAAEQRRQDLAVVRLRGKTRNQARAFLVRALLPVVLLGWPVGVLAAVALSRLASAWVLPAPVLFELTSGFVLATVLVALVLAAATLAVAHRASRVELVDLLRRTPQRRTRWAMGAFEATVVAVAAAFAGAALTGTVRGPAGLVLPSFLALGLGLTCAHLVGPVASRVGQRLLARGRFRGGVGVLHAARRPATRQLVAILTVGVALLVFAADAVAVAARNRDLAAQQQLGAPMRATVVGNDVVGVRAALDRVDPDGRSVTPVVTFGGRGGTETTMAVLPAGYAHVAFTETSPGLRDALTRLRPPDAEPVRITGGRLRSTARWIFPSGVGSLPYRVVLEVVPTGGDATTVDLGTVGVDEAAPLEATLPCREGCVVTGLVVRLQYAYMATGRVSTGTVRLGPLMVDGGPVRLGRASDWPIRDVPAGHLTLSHVGTARTDVEVDNFGVAELAIGHAWRPALLPVVQNPPKPDEGTRVVSAFDGEFWQDRNVGHVDRIPGGPPGTSLVNLDTLSRAGERPSGDASLALLFRSGSPRLETGVRDALRAEGLTMTGVRRLDDVRTELASSVPAWSLLLGILIGAIALLMCGVALVVVAATTNRARSRDLAALSMAGAPSPAVSRVALVEQLPALAVAVPVGFACGVLGAAISLDRVPLFASPPLVSTLDLTTAWGTALLAALVAALVLGAVARQCGRRVARDAVLDRVRDTL